MYKKRKYLYALFAFMIAALICIPQALQMRTQAAAKPGTVKLNSISAPAYNKINVKWKKTSSATHYIVYYKKEGTKKWTKIKTLDNSKSSYTHTSSKKYPIVVGQKYTYTVIFTVYKIFVSACCFIPCQCYNTVFICSFNVFYHCRLGISRKAFLIVRP